MTDFYPLIDKAVARLEQNTIRRGACVEMPSIAALRLAV
jgi:hypothetical protein